VPFTVGTPKNPFVAVPKLVGTLLKPVPVLIKLFDVATPELHPKSIPTVEFIIVLCENVPAPVAETAVALPMSLFDVTVSPVDELMPLVEVLTIVFPEIVAPPLEAMPTPPPSMKLPEMVAVPPCNEMPVGAPVIELPCTVKASVPLVTDV